MISNRRLLYFSPAARGGIADYAREQADAISGCGIQVDLLTTPEFKFRLGDRYQILARLSSKPVTCGDSHLWSRIKTVRQILLDIRELSQCILQCKYRHVLFGSYLEYLAPVWARWLRGFSRQGVVFGAVVHDPVRDAVIGPLWWHRWSIAEGYSFLRETFVHEPLTLETVRVYPKLRTTVIPHGCYNVKPAVRSAQVVRKELHISEEATVLLAFGHIRDNKNLHLVLQALRRFPNVILVVAGKELSRTQRPVSYYQQKATEYGVEDQCRWLTEFIPETQIGELFAAANLILLTYNGQFRSASGVLNLAAGYQRPCIASAGQSNLETVVNKYSLGIWVRPDSEDALIEGLRKWFSNPKKPDWTQYIKETSWARNANLIIQRMYESKT